MNCEGARVSLIRRRRRTREIRILARKYSHYDARRCASRTGMLVVLLGLHSFGFETTGTLSDPGIHGTYHHEAAAVRALQRRKDRKGAE